MYLDKTALTLKFWNEVIFIINYLQGHQTADPPDEDVEAVMRALIGEFQEVTSCDNSETARYYIDKCQMNINQAIVCYYEDLP